MTSREAPPGRRVAVLAPASPSGEAGGAERLYGALVEALRAAGCSVTRIDVPTDETTFAGIVDAYERCRLLDLSSYEFVVSTKAPTYVVRHPNHVVYLVHTMRVFYDMFDMSFPQPSPTLLEQRRHIQGLDTEALGRVRRRFAIGHEVAARLRKWNRLDAEVLHPPLGLNRFRPGRSEGYFFLPGRLHSWKRVDLVIRAVQGSSLPLRLLIAGSGEAEADLRKLAADDHRIEFLGRVSDDRLIECYAGCLAVPFVPLREDYGYVTLEAFSAGKPVITCRDSGEPVQFVVHGENGLISEPTPESLREAMETCFRAPEAAAEMGQRGQDSIRHIIWPNVVGRLLAAGSDGAVADPKAGLSKKAAIRVAILDMQPIEPAVGGGRLRLLGLYHALGEGTEARYVGSYDWPGEGFRRQRLTPTLEEVVVPLSEAHHKAARQLSLQAGGKVVIDVAFGRLGHLSPEYLAEARDAVEWADVVVVSHPWTYPLVADRIRPDQLVVYDAHNVEGFLRAQLLDLAEPVERDLLKEVISAEYRAGLRADVVLACSAEDRAMFERVYEWPGERIRLVPNGAMTDAIVPASDAERTRIRASIGVPADAVMAAFVGSPYAPNVEAARFIVDELAPALPNVTFAVIGGVGGCLDPPVPANVRITGFVDEAAKVDWLRASDLAVNPMFSGSGTNIKMFDFMAAGLPVVTTSVGSRGISDAEGGAMQVVANRADDLVAAVSALAADENERRGRGIKSRALAEANYSWGRISRDLGELLRRGWQRKEQGRYGRRPLMALLTTWNTKCGVAEHAWYLVEALERIGWDVVVLGNRLPPGGPVNPRQEVLVPCLRVWTWDNIYWTSSDLDVGATRSALARLAPDVLFIQHHTGFVSGDRYEQVLGVAAELELPVLVELHNPRDLVRLGGVGMLGGKRISLIVHDEKEREMLADKTTSPITTMLLPVQAGVATSSAGLREAKPIGGSGGPLIGGFGFLRPYKGVKKAIQIIADVRRSFPGVRYLGYHASYQSGESGAYLRECLAEADRLGVADAVSIDTAFRDIGEVIDDLRHVDVVLLPYEQLLEGASASANVAVAAGRPIVTSSAQIFNPLRDVVQMVEDDSTAAYVRALEKLFRDKEFARQQALKTSRWAEEHSYDVAARRVDELVSALLRCN